MIQGFLDYSVSVVIGMIAGFAIGALARDPWGGALIGALVGVFMGAGVRAWRTRDTPDSYEERGLGD